MSVRTHRYPCLALTFLLLGLGLFSSALPLFAQAIEAEDIEPSVEETAPADSTTPAIDPDVPASQPPEPIKDFATLLQEAELAYAEGRYEEAVAAYAAAARAAPSLPEQSQTLVTLAVLQHSENQADAARASLAEAVYLTPQLALAPDRYPIALLDLFYEAQREALERRSQEASTRLQDARAAFDRGDDATSREDLAATLALSPNDPNALLLLALVDLRQKRLAEAEAGFEKILSLRQAQPGYVSDAVAATALANLGHFYREREFWEDAETRLRQAVDLDPSLGEAWVDLALAQRALGLREAARTSLLRARSLQPGNEVVLYNLGLAQMETGQNREALEMLLDATNRNPQSARLWSLLAQAQATSSDATGQEASLRRVLELDPVNRLGVAASAARSLALLRLQASDFSGAAELARRVLAFEATNALAWSYLGAAQRGQGLTTEALESLQKAAELGPAQPEFHNDLGALLFQLDRYTEAVPRFERALELRAAYPEATENLALAKTRLAELALIEKDLGLRVARLPAGEPARTGLRVEFVTPGGSGERADMLPGDLLIRIEKAPIATPADLVGYLSRTPPLKNLDAEWLRQSRLMKGKLRLPRD